jgi:hypothetical protein
MGQDKKKRQVNLSTVMARRPEKLSFLGGAATEMILSIFNAKEF